MFASFPNAGTKEAAAIVWEPVHRAVWAWWYNDAEDGGGREAAQSIDQKLSSFEQRFSDLVTQNTGAIDTLESAVKKVSMGEWMQWNACVDCVYMY